MIISVTEIRKIYEANPTAWEPRDITSPAVDQLIHRGFLRKVDGRCGFESFRDSMLTWTDCARELFRPDQSALTEQSS